MKNEPIERLIAQFALQTVLQRIHGSEFGDKGYQTDKCEFYDLPNIGVAPHERLALFHGAGGFAPLPRAVFFRLVRLVFSCSFLLVHIIPRKTITYILRENCAHVNTLTAKNAHFILPHAAAAAARAQTRQNISGTNI